MITKEYIEGLQKKVEELVNSAADTLNSGEADEVNLFAMIRHLQGYVEVLNADSYPSQNAK